MQSTNESLVCLLKEGCGIRSISRILGISAATVIRNCEGIKEGAEASYFIWQGVRARRNAYLCTKKDKVVVDSIRFEKGY